MTAADMVNRILEKFRTGKVVFSTIDEEGVEVTIGGQLYDVWTGELGVMGVYHLIDGEHKVDSYSRWVMGVLQGKTRDENGVLS